MDKPWLAEKSITPALVRQLIQGQFPEFGTEPDIQSMGEGWDNAAYLVNQTHVFRFPRRAIAVDLLGVEIQALGHLAAQLPLPITHPTHIGQPSADFDWPFAGYRRLPGQTACALAAPPSMREAWAQPLAQFLKALHATPVDQARAWGIDYGTYDKLDVPRVSGEIQSRLETGRKMGHGPLADAALAYLEAHNDIEGTQASTVVHGDLYARHLLIDGGELTGIIDWGDLHIGDQGVDLSVVFTVLPPSAHARFFDHYGEVSPQTLEKAKFRALLSAVTIWIYGADIADADLHREGHWALCNLLGHPMT